MQRNLKENNTQCLHKCTHVVRSILAIRQFHETFVKSWNENINEGFFLWTDGPGVELHGVQEYHDGYAEMEPKVQEVIPKFNLWRRP
jgi:hypothetical protein